MPTVPPRYNQSTIGNYNVFNPFKTLGHAVGTTAYDTFGDKPGMGQSLTSATGMNQANAADSIQGLGNKFGGAINAQDGAATANRMDQAMRVAGVNSNFKQNTDVERENMTKIGWWR